jgi:uncharacterized protein (DUF1499 family)
MILDFRTLRLGWRPNQFLMLPAGFAAAAKPHATSPVYAAAPPAVLDTLKTIALAEPRTVVKTEDGPARQIAFVQRSKTFGFPDDVTVEAVPVPGGTALAAYSRARIGIRDFGVNRARIERWAGKLSRAFGDAGAA